MIRHVSNGYVSRAEMARHSRVSGMSSLERRGYAKDVSLNFMCSRNTSHHVSILTVLKQPFIFGINRVRDCPDMASPDRIAITRIENRPFGAHYFLVTLSGILKPLYQQEIRVRKTAEVNSYSH